MKIVLIIFIFCFTYYLTYGQQNHDGFYSALEEMCWKDSVGKKECFTDPDHPEWKWYHLSTIKIAGDSAYLGQVPVCIDKRKDTLYSASDGGFYYYKGTNKIMGETITIDLKEVCCDYCGEPVDEMGKRIYRTKAYIGLLQTKGILFNNILYKRTRKKEINICE